MTSHDTVLDPAVLFQNEPLDLYRITRFKYANLSGEGAAKSPGRWNAPGEEAIYTAFDLGATVLERLVHTPKDRIPDDLALMTLHLTGRWSDSGDGFIDDATGGIFATLTSLAQAETPRFDELSRRWGSPFALAIPSVIVPVWNVVLFPQAPGFWQHVSIHSVEDFMFDPRLFPTNALQLKTDKNT